jgi:hypothetical protein
VRKQGPEHWDTWRHQSPPQQGDGIQSCMTRGDIGALLNRKAGSGAAEHVMTLCLGFIPICGVPICRISRVSDWAAHEGV